MARLRKQSPTGATSGDEFSSKKIQRSTTAASTRISPRKKTAPKSNSQRERTLESESESDECTQPVLRVPSGATGKKRQIRLAPLKSLESSSELFSKASPEKGRRRPLIDLGSRTPRLVNSCSPKKNVQSKRSESPIEVAEPTQPQLNLSEAPPMLAPSCESEETPGDAVDFEESVWCGSDASSSEDDELPIPRKLWPMRPPERKEPLSNSPPPTLDDAISGLRDLGLDEKASKKGDIKPQPLYRKQSDSRPSSSSDKENYKAILRFSPPRLFKPAQDKALDRPVTPPPASPSKSKLVSPSKTKAKIPTPPLHQHLDDFWNADTVNYWNDQYSPQKTIQSPNKNFYPNTSTSPTSSPKKSSQSPTKRTKAETLAKKDFATRKHALASSFLIELDATITFGQIASLSASTGGVRFLWSKTLTSTAGRANWRRETTKTRHLDGSVTATYKHHASIELAEKVIDDETRLLNVLAHEFCHLANFMVSGVKDQPHGVSFKRWGRLCTERFADRGVEVTTKHSYEIEYRYVWRCSGEKCGQEFKRHSKSIDPKRHTCGSCRERLVQVKPVPRKGGAEGAVTGYAAFVKANYAEIKRGLPRGTGQKEVMEAVGRKYRAEKQAGGGATAGAKGEPEKGLEDVVRGLEIVALDD